MITLGKTGSDLEIFLYIYALGGVGGGDG